MNTHSAFPGLSRSGLTVLLVGQLLPLIDFSIVNVALDAISISLKASPVELELIVAAYGIAFAISLAMGSRWGDNFGRRRVFTAGVLLFGLASLLCGLADSVWLLLVARALQGIGAALIVPQILATLHVCLKGKEHARAIGLYGAIGGLAFIIGQVLGGLLIAADLGGYGWRSVFLINIPFCLAVLLCVRSVPETRNAQPVPVDWPGTLLLAGATGCLMMALAFGPLLRWSWPCILLLAVFPLLLRQLWLAERKLEQRQGAPLLPPALLRLASMQFGLGMAVIFFACWSGFMFTVALTLQSGLGMTPFQSGNAFIALGAAYFFGAMVAASVVVKLGKKVTLFLGCVIQMSGLLALIATFSYAWPATGIALLIPATSLIGLGQSFIVNCFYRIGLAEVTAEYAGAGSAMLSTVQQTALGLGPMLMGTLFSEKLHRHGSYKEAIVASLIMELLLMSLLALSAYATRRAAPLQPE
ncbi:MFS transporter [Kalamiella sp. sgz302252]|uniref:MFS transporter n=1 Tax=Pantoea sp. sgz302252 TaxID=3341827 RepID=UPI0036D25FBF